MSGEPDPQKRIAKAWDACAALINDIDMRDYPMISEDEKEAIYDVCAMMA